MTPPVLRTGGDLRGGRRVDGRGVPPEMNQTPPAAGFTPFRRASAPRQFRRRDPAQQVAASSAAGVRWASWVASATLEPRPNVVACFVWSALEPTVRLQ